MKKFLLSILTMLYMTVSSGIAMEIHYCMGERAGVDLFGADSKKCGRCGMVEKSGCCSDEHKFFKLSDEHKNVTNDHTSFTAIEDLNISYAWHTPLVAVPGTSFGIPSPPVDSGPPLYIANCTFRI